MPYFLGFDGGGTKTECVILASNGGIVAQGLAGPSNPLRVGYEEAVGALKSAAAEAFSRANVESQAIRAVCAGLAGAGRPGVAEKMESMLAAAYPDALIHVATDLEVALEAAAGPEPGVVLIAGTGSAAFGRNAAGQVARAGGYGPWIGDEGSAFDIGRRAVAAIARARDRDVPAPRFAQMILAELACPNWDELVERIARKADAVFPRLFPVVAKAGEDGDGTASGILLKAAAALAALVDTVVGRLNLQSAEFVLAKSGGIFGHSRLLDSRLDASLATLAPRARIGLLNVSPAMGAGRLAVRLAGESFGM